MKNDLKGTRSGYIQVTENQLFYQKFGTGSPLLIIHGGPGLDHTYLLPQMLELAQDYELIFYDQRCCGRSLTETFDPQYITIEQFSQDIENLSSQLGYKKITLLGHSWGGMLAMDYAVKYPENVTSLILLNCAPANNSGEQAFREVLTSRMKPIQENISALFDYDSFQKLNENQINKLYRDLLSVYFKDPKKVVELTLKMSYKAALNGFTVRALLTDSVSEVRENLLSSLKKIKIPTLIIHGDHDIVPSNTAQEIKSAISGAKILFLKDCDHFSHIEAPEALFDCIKSFLK